jgi:hypothetical protein
MGKVIYRLSIVSLSPSHSLTRAPESLHKSLILFVFFWFDFHHSAPYAIGVGGI